MLEVIEAAYISAPEMADRRSLAITACNAGIARSFCRKTPILGSALARIILSSMTTKSSYRQTIVRYIC